MARLIELLLFAFLIYMFYRRLANPFRKGFDAREDERRKEAAFRRQAESGQMHRPTEPAQPRIDRTQVEDADFKDID